MIASYLYPLILFWGAVVGSFLNVVIFRMPRGFPVNRPSRSVCTSCFRKLAWYENVPVLSYVVLKGRCKSCGVRIGPRHLLIEILTAFVFLAVTLRWGLTVDGLYYLFFVSALIAVTFIDLDHRIIPDKISLPGIVFGVLASGFTMVHAFVPALGGAVLGGGLFWALAAGYEKITGREGLGLGDVKLLAMIGAFLGPTAVLGTILVSSVFGSVIGLGVIFARGGGLKSSLPYGPFLAIGAFCMLFWGDQFSQLLYH